MDRRLPGEIWLAINAHQDHGPPSRAYLPAVSRALREYLLPSFWKTISVDIISVFHPIQGVEQLEQLADIITGDAVIQASCSKLTITASTTPFAMTSEVRRTVVDSVQTILDRCDMIDALHLGLTLDHVADAALLNVVAAMPARPSILNCSSTYAGEHVVAGLAMVLAAGHRIHTFSVSGLWNMPHLLIDANILQAMRRAGVREFAGRKVVLWLPLDEPLVAFPALTHLTLTRSASPVVFFMRLCDAGLAVSLEELVLDVFYEIDLPWQPSEYNIEHARAYARSPTLFPVLRSLSLRHHFTAGRDNAVSDSFIWTLGYFGAPVLESLDVNILESHTIAVFDALRDFIDGVGDRLWPNRPLELECRRPQTYSWATSSEPEEVRQARADFKAAMAAKGILLNPTKSKRRRYEWGD